MRKITLFSSLMICFFTGQSQMTTTTGMTPLQYVQNVLLGNGVTVSNVTYTGYNNAIGEFNVAGATNLGMTNGLVLTTGSVLANDPMGFGGGTDGPMGPNNSGSSGIDNGQPGDPYLNSLLPPTVVTFNRAILEFDFIPTGDTVKFNYVFGTEEYMEFVGPGSNFADVFAFVLSGVTTSLPAVNIAQIPGTGLPVTALNVNANTNSQYYVDNENPPGQTVQYDGFTVVLEAIHPVVCGETYHLKIMIADAIDGSWDAGVFLQANSLSSNQISISAVSGSVIGGQDNLIVESCPGSEAVFTFTRPNGTGTETIHFNIGGTAVMGTDYTPIPDSVVFASGQTSTTFTVYPIPDSVSEGQESIVFYIVYTSGCGVDTIQGIIYIVNVDPYVISIAPPEEICSDAGQFAPLMVTATGGNGPLTYSWNHGAGFGDTVYVSPPETTVYTVVVSDTCGNSDSSTVEVIVQCDIVVPNIFTPNGDGINEFFHVKYMEHYPNSVVRVFNRFGKVVFESGNYQNNWNGGDVSDGTYYYVVTPSDPEQPEQHGYVTILREKD